MSKKNKPIKKWLWFGVVPLILLVGGSAGWYFFSHNNSDKEKDHNAPTIPVLPPVFLELEPFTVNLPPENKFLQATFTLQVVSSEDAAKLTIYLPQIRSKILLMLSAKNSESLLLVEGKTLLTNEISVLLKQPFEKNAQELPAVTVLITSFVIQ